MNRLVTLLPILCCIALLFLGGCANQSGSSNALKTTSTPLVCSDDTPPGETCLITAKTEFDWSGSQKHTVFATKVNDTGECMVMNAQGEKKLVKCNGVQVIGIKSEADRLSTITAPVLGLAGQFIEGHYRVKAAEEAEGDTWIIAPSANSSSGSSSFAKGGESLTQNNNLSSAGAVQSTGVNVDVDNNSGKTCKTGNCP